jgi:hypothetical protein
MSDTVEAPEEELDVNATAMHFDGMAEYWNFVAVNTYNEWAGMKYSKPKKDGEGHKSKNDFNDYKRMVYDRHKHFRLRANLCTAVAKMLREEDDSADLSKIGDGGGDSSIKNAGKIILGNFKNLIP